MSVIASRPHGSSPARPVGARVGDRRDHRPAPCRDESGSPVPGRGGR